METSDREKTLSKEHANKQEAKKTGSEKRRQKLIIRLLEVGILAPAILIIIGLFSLPTAFHALRGDTTTVSVGELQ